MSNGSGMELLILISNVPSEGLGYKTAFITERSVVVGPAILHGTETVIALDAFEHPLALVTVHLYLPAAVAVYEELIAPPILFAYFFHWYVSPVPVLA